MNLTNRPLAVILGIALLALLGLGLYVVIMKALGLFGSLDSRLIAILVVAIAAAVIIAGGLRSVAGSGERRSRLEGRLSDYMRLLEVWTQAAMVEGETDTGRAADALRAAERSLVLVASPGVLKTLVRLRRIAPADPAARTAVTALIREMRRDLGQSNVTLNDDDLAELLLRRRERTAK